MKISEVTTNELADYLRIDEPNNIELRELESMRESAIAYIKSYTGQSDEYLQECDDITQAMLVLVADMYDNRSMYVEKNSKVNQYVECVLGMHSINLV